MFLKFFDIYWNRPGIWLQKFAAGVTKLLTPDEIRRFDGIIYVIIWCYHFSRSANDIIFMLSFSLVRTYFVLSFMLSFYVVIYCYHFPPFFFFLKTWHTRRYTHYYKIFFWYTVHILASVPLIVWYCSTPPVMFSSFMNNLI